MNRYLDKGSFSKGNLAIGLDHCLDVVLAFQSEFDNPVAASPSQMNNERVLIRAEYLRSEIDEFIAASTIEGQCDALIDLIYFILGAFGELGVRPQAIFDIVHSSNMQKKFNDGSVKYSPHNGKVLKPPHWQPPDNLIIQEIKRQISEK